MGDFLERAGSDTLGASVTSTELIKEHWDDPATESLDDKHWAAAERRLIARYIPRGMTILDAGCGEGEGLEVYARLGPTTGVDYSETRLAMARQRCPTTLLHRVDLLCDDPPGHYDVVVSARLLINLKDWAEQRIVLQRLAGCLKPHGRLLLWEGSEDGQLELNAVRAAIGLPPIHPQWFNRFLDDSVLEDYAQGHLGLRLSDKTGLGAFFLLSRGVHQYFTANPTWDVAFNCMAASPAMETALNLRATCSRLRLWVLTNG